MQLYPDVFHISSTFGERNLFQYLFVGDRMILVDSGVATTPGETIIPFIERLKEDPRRLAMIVTTHPDGDRQGGNGVLKQLAPGVIIACGECDRLLVQDPLVLYRDRYNFLKDEHGLGFDDVPSADAGSRCKVDLGFVGGEHIAISNDLELEVLHVPGHSAGHLALFDRKNRAAFVSDAVHGRVVPHLEAELLCL